MSNEEEAPIKDATGVFDCATQAVVLWPFECLSDNYNGMSQIGAQLGGELRHG
jgi:hypothetical protein